MQTVENLSPAGPLHPVAVNHLCSSPRAFGRQPRRAMSSKHTSIAIYNLYIQSIQVLYTNVHTYITLRCIAIQLPLQLQSQYIHHHTSVYIQYIEYIVSEFKMKKTWHRGSYDPSRTPAHSTSVRPSKILTVSVTSRIKKDLGSQSTTAKPSKTMRTG